MAGRICTDRLALGLALLASACGGEDLTLPNQGEPAALEIFDGDRQNGTVGQALGESLVVQVTDRFGDPVPGVTVRWSAEGGGSVSPTESTTDAQGQASTERVLGAEPSTYFTIATVEGLEPPVTFTSTGLTARLVITSQLPAIATSGVPLSPQPTLQLQDADGTPIASEGVIVSVQIASGGGSLTGGTTATSNAAGEVAFTDLAIRGEPGTRHLIFAAEAFAPATSPPIALGVGAPASIEPVAGDDQSATAGEPVPIPPAVRVRDEDGNPLSGIPVTFRVTQGGGTVSGGTPVTDRDGLAAVGAWRLGTSAGANELVAEVSGQELSGSPVVFSATATAAGVSATESAVEASPATITASTGASAATITVRVRDGFGNPIEGVAVTLAVGGSGHTLTQPGGPTDANGVATGRFSSTVAGNHTVTATAGGVAIEQAAAVAVQPGAPLAANSSATVPEGRAGQPTVIGIRLEDAFGNPVPGRANAIGVGVAGVNNVGTLTPSDQGGGSYTATYTPQVVGEDRVTIGVSGTAVPGSPFVSLVRAGPVSPEQTTAVVTRTIVGIFPFTSRVDAVVTARDALGNPVGQGGATVLMSVDGGAPVAAVDNGDGTYTASTVVPGVQFDEVAITLDGTPIQGSPFSVP
jgi:hypothetical protein